MNQQQVKGRSPFWYEHCKLKHYKATADTVVRLKLNRKKNGLEGDQKGAVSMNPLFTALGSNPDAVRAALRELKPVLRSAFRHVRPPWASASRSSALVALTSAFAAGMAVGWFTAPRSGAQLRLQTRESVQTWIKWCLSLGNPEDKSPDIDSEASLSKNLEALEGDWKETVNSGLESTMPN